MFLYAPKFSIYNLYSYIGHDIKPLFYWVLSGMLESKQRFNLWSIRKWFEVSSANFLANKPPSFSNCTVQLSLLVILLTFWAHAPSGTEWHTPFKMKFSCTMEFCLDRPHPQAPWHSVTDMSWNWMFIFMKAVISRILFL